MKAILIIFFFKGSINFKNEVCQYDREYTKKPSSNNQIEIKFLARTYVFDFLTTYCGRNINSYGILTGVRPLKLVHSLYDQGFKLEQMKNILINNYRLSSDKTKLLLEIAQNNRSYIASQSNSEKRVSVYIAIPYCPSRCYYCSFPGRILKNYESEMMPYLQALEKELQELAKVLKEDNYIIENIYLGGGTPTILTDKDLDSLFQFIEKNLISKLTKEITVEGGRPETMTASKLKILKDYGTKRICINPQTMNENTLLRIGRYHKNSDIFQAYEMAREVGIEQINMDLIIGLPEEDLKIFEASLEKVLLLKPNNITVHALAVKKGSQLAETEGKDNIKQRINEVESCIAYSYEKLKQESYEPYYIYRQKYMQANVENIGYALKGDYGIYNIQIMEERQNIIGLGAGAASKFVNSDDWSLDTFHNPKDILSYIKSIDRLITSKVDKLRGLN